MPRLFGSPKALASRLHRTFVDADDLHSQESKLKMRSGIALTEEDRRPWLKDLAATIARAHTTGLELVVACSALKRRYREELAGADSSMRIVFLRGAPDLIAKRLARRAGHFMPAALLPDQLNVLEEPEVHEDAIVVDVGAPVQVIVERVLCKLYI